MHNYCYKSLLKLQKWSQNGVLRIGLLFVMSLSVQETFAKVDYKLQSITNTRITLSLRNEPISKVISAIEKHANLSVAYNSQRFNTQKRINIEVKDELISKVFDRILEGYDGSVTQLDDKHIIINVEPAPTEAPERKTSETGVKKFQLGKDIAVTGAVHDEDGSPIPGANVVVKGTTHGTSTDENGHFLLDVEGKSILVVSYMGYISQEIVVENSNPLKITMKGDAKNLNEVVVIGYGSKRRDEVVGAVSTVPVKDIKSRNYGNTAEVLQGTVPGVTVMSNGGSPTSSPTFKIRGIGSINDENPLLVVDGVIYNGSFNSINPRDIDNISVLKDASAAVYGARASGGVVLITTKKGSKGAPRASINYQQGFQQTGKRLEALNAGEFADVVNKVRAEGNLSPDPAFDPNQFPDARTTKTNWMDEIFQTGRTYDFTGSISGGSDRASFFASGGYRHNEGVLLNSYASRLSARINSTFKLTDNITIGENFSFSQRNGRSGNTSSAQEGSILTAIFYPPNATVYREDGSGKFGGVPDQYPGSYGDVINPVANLKRLDVNNPVTETLLNPYLEWNIIPGLKFRSNWSYTRIKNDMKQFFPKVLEPGKIFNYNELTQSSSTFTSMLSEQTMQYEPNLGSDHSLNILVGHTFEKWMNESFTVTATGFDNESENLRYLSNSTQPIAIGKYGGNGYETVLESYLGRASYSYKKKYLLDAIIRRDGTSKLTSGNRWEWYPSVAAGWVLKRERFLENADYISNLKLRASWGRIGNLGVLGNYAFSMPLSKTQGLLGQSTTIVPGYAETQLSNPNLRWEISEQKNVGVDFSFFKNKLSGTVDMFIKENSQMQLTQNLPGLAGTPGGQTINAGVMQNKGIELGLGYRSEVGEVKYSITANAAFLKNRVKELYDGTPSYQTGTSVRGLPLPNIVRRGDPFSSFYGYQTQGLFNSQEEIDSYVGPEGNKIQPNAKPGDIRFADTNGDGTIGAADQDVLGNAFPKITYSLDGGLAYKSFDFNVFFQGVSGNKVFNAVKYTGLNAAFPGYNLLAEIKNAWTPENTNTDVPRVSYTDANNNFGRMSDFYIEDGSYIRLKSITLGYTLPATMLKGMQPRIFVTGQNLFTISKYSGMDPEVGLGSQGLDLGLYPVAKTFMFGIDINF
jgi:TonB-linked SusC/RagA family outer membrane protein